MTYGDLVLTLREFVSRRLADFHLWYLKGWWDAGTDSGDLRHLRKARERSPKKPTA